MVIRPLGQARSERRPRVSLAIDGLSKRFGDVVALDGASFTRRAGQDLRSARCERCGQDDRDADRARHPSRRLGPGHVDGDREHRVAAQHVGLSARGARFVPEDEGRRAAALLLGPLRRAGRAGARRDHRLARALPDPRLPRPQGRGALEGQPAEDPVHRRDPARPRGADHGRAVHRARPGQRSAAEGGLRRDARPGQDPDLQHAPDGDGRGAVRVDRDHRPRPRHRQRAGARREARHGTPGRAAGDRRRRPRCGLARRAARRRHQRPPRGLRRAPRAADRDPETILRAALDRGDRVSLFEIAEPSLEEIFIEHVGRRAVDEEEEHLATTGKEAAG